MKSTPSVYVTKVGGGFGDSRINMRGFDATNIAVIINGQPVNDMQSGAVYWSNWTGLADIASSIQIQRGLGASKFVVPSVGGTINIVTKATDSEQKAMVKAEVGNDSYSRLSAMYSSGLKTSGERLYYFLVGKVMVILTEQKEKVILGFSLLVTSQMKNMLSILLQQEHHRYTIPEDLLQQELM